MPYMYRMCPLRRRRRRTFLAHRSPFSQVDRDVRYSRYVVNRKYDAHVFVGVSYVRQPMQS